MRTLITLLSVLLLGASTPQSDDAAIRDVIARYVAVRNHMDVAALRELFTPDADQLVSTGIWRRGLDDLVQGAVASSKKENGQSSVTLESVRMLGPDTAIADGRYVTSSRNMWSAFVLRRLDSGWRIAAIRNMLPVP